MLPVRSALLSSVGAGPSTSQAGGGNGGGGGNNGGGATRGGGAGGRVSPTQQAQQRRERRETALLAVACVALLAASWFLGAQLGKPHSSLDGGGGSSAWRSRRARQDALDARDAEAPAGLLRRALEREEVLERLRQGRCKAPEDFVMGMDGQEEDEERLFDEDEELDEAAAANGTNTPPALTDEEKKEARLQALAERLSQHPAARGLNLSSAQQAELNHNGYEDSSAKLDDPDDTEFRVLCIGDSLTLGLYQNSGKYRPFAIALERGLRRHLEGTDDPDPPDSVPNDPNHPQWRPLHSRDHTRGTEDRHEYGSPKKRLERKRHRAKSVHVVSSGIGGETVLGGMRERMSGLLAAAEGRTQPVVKRRSDRGEEGGEEGEDDNNNNSTTTTPEDDLVSSVVVDARRYDVVVIFGGINDILRDKADPENLFKQGLARMYTRARRGHGAATLAVTLLDEAAADGGMGSADAPDGTQPESSQWKRDDVNRRIRLEAAEAFARDLQSEEIRRMDGDWSDGGAGPLGVFDAALELPLYEKKQEEKEDGDGGEKKGEKKEERKRTPWFDGDALHLSYEGYERLGELMAKRIVDMGWI